jgi:hypothetical protein
MRVRDFRHSHLQHRQEFNRAEVEEEVEEEVVEEEEEEEELINQVSLAKPAPLSPGWDISCRRTSSPRIREQIVRALNAERVARALRASLFQGQFGDVAAE